MTRWDDVGDLRRLLDPESLTELLGEADVPATAAVADHLRLKVGTNALVGVKIDGPGGGLAGYVRTYDDPGQARRTAEKWNSTRVQPTALGPGIRLLPGGASVLFLFPNDARVRRLGLLLGKPRRLARLLGGLDTLGDGHLKLSRTTVEVLRYKPERRVVGAAHLWIDRQPRTAVFRLRGEDAGLDLSVVTRRLHTALGRFVPRPLGEVFNGALVAEEQVPGPGLAAAVATGEADPGALAEAVAALHGCGVPLPSGVDPGEILARALAALDLLAAVDPSLQPAADRLRAALVAALPAAAPALPLHGDLHLDQVILAPGGPVVLDFERAAMGPAAHDLGTLVAHLQANGQDAFAAGFLDAYGRARPVDLAGLAFYVACGLVQRALLAFRSLRPGWQATVPHLLELAGQRLDGRRRWDVAFPRRSGPWPAWTGAGGARRYGRWDPAQHTLTEAEPQHDDALPALGPLLEGGGSLVAYRPGQRAVVRVEGQHGPRFVKVVSPRRARRLVTRTLAVSGAAATTPGFPVLAPILDACVERGTVTFAAVAGPTLGDRLRAGRGDDALPAVAAAVAAFQSAPVPEEITTGSGSSLEDWAGFVAASAPGLAPSYFRVLRALPEVPVVERLVLAHGDLHDGNVVLAPAGVALLDLDGVVAADPAEDVGNLMAHLVLRGLQRGEGPDRGREQARRLLAAYHEAGGQAAPDGVEAVVARALFRLACVHLFRGHWHALAPLLLTESASRHVTGLRASR